MKRMMMVMAVATALCWTASATAGDPAAGEAIYNDQCSDCHEPDDFSGESAADISVWIVEAKDSKKHKGKVDIAALSAEDVANVAAFYAQ
ncbi:MAG: hypothetical protein WBN65_04885 [Gammaproteobacteria bacterium]